MIKDVFIAVIHDGWTQAGILGATIMAISRVLIATIGETVSMITMCGSAILVTLAIVEKSMAIIAQYHKRQKERMDGTDPGD